MSPVLPSEVAEALSFADQVVMPQGAIFIRELLRSKRDGHAEVRLGIGKEEVKENLRAAIRSGAVRMDDLVAFIASVEGWGNQHIYLYDATAVAALDLWKSPQRLRRALAGVADEPVWKDVQEPSFPDELELGAASFADGRFELLWREKDEHWWRDAAKDKAAEVIEGDLYEFRAYRRELRRSVMRFVLFLAAAKAGLFVQIPLGKRHTAALRIAEETIAPLFPFGTLRAADISNAIKVLDTRELEAGSDAHGQMRAQNTKFEAKGATVEFDADPALQAWKEVAAVRRVRQALKTKDFQGHGGRFVVSLRLGRGLNRDVIMSLSGGARRIYLQAQLTTEEAWTILDQVLAASLTG
jgi:hypothetical protein